MKFPIKRYGFIAACFLLIGLTLSGCNAQVTESPESLQVVVNDKNRALGIVTMEDILEELVGDILDERDTLGVKEAQAV